MVKLSAKRCRQFDDESLIVLRNCSREIAPFARRKGPTESLLTIRCTLIGGSERQQAGIDSAMLPRFAGRFAVDAMHTFAIACMVTDSHSRNQVTLDLLDRQHVCVPALQASHVSGVRADREACVLSRSLFAL